MKTKLFFLLLAFSVVFVSCEKEEETKKGEEETEKKTVELLDSYKNVNGDLTVDESYTYNDDLQLIKIKRTMGGSTSEYELEYNDEGQLITVYVGDNLYASYSYNGSAVAFTNYYNGEVSGVRNCVMNANNKIVREQLEGSDYYDTFVWDGDNMTKRTTHSPDGETTTTSYTYNDQILQPGFGMYFSFKHPMFSCKNACSESLFSYNDEVTEYTLTANDKGYLSKRVFTNIIGKSTSSYYYKTVEIEE